MRLLLPAAMRCMARGTAGLCPHASVLLLFAVLAKLCGCAPVCGCRPPCGGVTPPQRPAPCTLSPQHPTLPPPPTPAPPQPKTAPCTLHPSTPTLCTPRSSTRNPFNPPEPTACTLHSSTFHHNTTRSTAPKPRTHLTPQDNTIDRYRKLLALEPVWTSDAALCEHYDTIRPPPP